MARRPIAIDRAKLRAVVRRLRHEHLFLMLDDAIEVLPPAKLLAIAGKYIDLDLVRPDADAAARPGLLAAVRHFEGASLAGEYYQAFRRQLQELHRAVRRDDILDRRVPAAPRSVRNRTEEREP
jgi:hypothetical protein